MDFAVLLEEKLNKYNLLNHSFYRAWSEGKLSVETLQTYATEYYHHVAAFPRYISGIHSLCSDLTSRQVLLGNLIEEEQGEENHPELWKRFSEGLGVSRNALNNPPVLQDTKNLVEGFFHLTRLDYAIGLGALYAYESQTPGVAQSKIEGLKKYYRIKDKRTLQFFEVHMQADEWHSQEIAGLISSLGQEGQDKVVKGAEAGAKLLWKFLDGVVVCMGLKLKI